MVAHRRRVIVDELNDDAPGGWSEATAPADVNRDGRIDYSDVFDAVWPNLFAPAPLSPITPPGAPPARLESTDLVFNENLPWAIELLWFDESHNTSSHSEEEKDTALEATIVDGVYAMYYEE